MGCGSSTDTEGKLSPYEPVLRDLSPYGGPPVQYHFLVVNATLKTQEGYGNNLKFHPSNVDQYLPSLAGMYQQGYRLVLNVCLPVATYLTWGWSDISSRVMNSKYLGIFRLGLADELNNPAQLRMQSFVVLHKTPETLSVPFWLNDTNIPECESNAQAIYDVFKKITSEGGRVICLEYSQMGRQQVDVYRVHYGPPEDSEAAQVSDGGPAEEMQLHVNVYYETPVSQSNERYNYDFVMCPMNVSGSYIWARCSRKLTIDWQAATKRHLDAGWMLTDIFDDQSASVNDGYEVDKKLLWIFEKPASRFADNSPVYEITMEEIWFAAKKHVSGMHPYEVRYPTPVEPLLNHMATAGWEVVKILETPQQKFKGLLSLTCYTKYLVFFQRRIVLTPAPDSEPVK